MILYPDANAWVKRYVAENHNLETRAWFDAADELLSCRIGFVETICVLGGTRIPEPSVVTAEFQRHWADVTIIELDDALMRRAGQLAVQTGLRSMDAIHLAAAETLSGLDLAFATWDRRLWQAASGLGIPLLPESQP